jgi:PIN like domain
VKPPEPFTGFVDRSLGRKIAVDVRAAGFQIEEHSVHFADNAPDSEWLAGAGRRGWVVLTKDKAVRRNALEWAAILAERRGLLLSRPRELKAEQMAQVFVAARARMEKALRRYDPPMTASVTSTGHVSVLMADGELLPKPKTIK